jgi:hypothetical protein
MCYRGRQDNMRRPSWAMLTRISAALLAFIVAGMAPLHGQDQPASAAPGPIVTDRPAITNSSIVVPAGSVQAENGFLETSNQGQSIIDGPETLLRLGVATRTELRFTAPDYYQDLTNTGGPGIRRLRRRSKTAAWPHTGWIRRIGHPLSQFSHRRPHCIQRRVRSRIAGTLVARAFLTMDGGGDALLVLAHPGAHAKSDWRVHLYVGSATDGTLGCVCRVRGQVSRTRWAAGPAAFRNSAQNRQAAPA